MKNIGINVNTIKDPDKKVLRLIEKAIMNENKSVNIMVYEDGNGLEKLDKQSLDVIAVLGGDGTILSTLRHIYKFDIPIFGINIGHLGFLTQVDGLNITCAIKNLFQKNYAIEERTMIECSYNENGQLRIYRGLNDVVLYKALSSRIQKYEVFINSKYYNTFNADGIIVCTPTGSTAYNLAAGGPIIHPELDTLALTPMYSQSLASRTIVLDGKSKISVRVRRDDESVFLSVDGQEWIETDSTKTIDICRANYTCKLVKFCDNDYFTTLRRKITYKAKECEGEIYESNKTC